MESRNSWSSFVSPLGDHFHPSVAQVANIAGHLERLGEMLGGEAKSHTLHSARVMHSATLKRHEAQLAKGRSTGRTEGSPPHSHHSILAGGNGPRQAWQMAQIRKPSDPPCQQRRRGPSLGRTASLILHQFKRTRLSKTVELDAIDRTAGRLDRDLAGTGRPNPEALERFGRCGTDDPFALMVTFARVNGSRFSTFKTVLLAPLRAILTETKAEAMVRSSVRPALHRRERSAVDPSVKVVFPNATHPSFCDERFTTTRPLVSPGWLAVSVTQFKNRAEPVGRRGLFVAHARRGAGP